MIEIKNSVIIHSNKDQVFNYLCDFENFPYWNYSVSKVEKLNKTNNNGYELYGIYRNSSGPRYEEGFIKNLKRGERIVFTINGGWFPYEVEYNLSGKENKIELTNLARLYPNLIKYVPLLLAKNQLKRAVGQNLNVLKETLEQA
ncbi:SRPBCC family protein [Paucisalibacillus globulus]|uniref:SRPBCC family protein n=1 Tax=Paucisalibacillus globulus TaxID=351095 RepID=UPI000BB6AFC6|nr:SRPBCC family protein [Paucisalibacillus globulus]